MSKFKQTALTSIDSYKLSHADQYPVGTTKVYSNFTPRSLRHLNIPSQYKENSIVWFGLQAFLEELVWVWDETFFKQPKSVIVGEFSELVAPFCGPKGFDTSRIEFLHDLGYLPLEIKALPEGTLVPAGVPVLTITNTVPEAYWLPNYLETWISTEMWKMSTSATISYSYRKIIDSYAELTGGNKEFIQWQAHDFSVRGMSGISDAAKSGAGHLLSFAGTDNIPAVKLVNDVYNGNQTFVGGSVPATEHATMTASILSEVDKLGEEYERRGIDTCTEELFVESELSTIKRLITEIYPSGVVSVVSDSFDFWKVITEIAPTLKNEILSRVPDQLGLAKVVFRPDSGDPVQILCGRPYSTVKNMDDICALIDAENTGHEVVYSLETNKYYEFCTYDTGWSTDVDYEQIPEHIVKGSVECLWDTFGGTVNEKGFKTLNQRVGLIYGDSITTDRCNEILKQLAKKGFASDNVVFGIGSFTFQYNTRDTLGFAMKATYIEVAGKGISIFKDPKTDNGTKKSAKGLLKVDRVDGKLALFNDVTAEEEQQGMLRPVFKDGTILVKEEFADIRSRLGVI